MSLKPIDNSVALPRSQEVSKLRQDEISKNKNNIDNNFIKRDKNAIENQKKVIKTKETKYNKIGDEESRQESRNSKNKDKKDSDDKEEDENTPYIGKNIDIRI